MFPRAAQRFDHQWLLHRAACLQYAFSDCILGRTQRSNQLSRLSLHWQCTCRAVWVRPRAAAECLRSTSIALLFVLFHTSMIYYTTCLLYATTTVSVSVQSLHTPHLTLTSCATGFWFGMNSARYRLASLLHLRTLALSPASCLSATQARVDSGRLGRCYPCIGVLARSSTTVPPSDCIADQCTPGRSPHIRPRQHFVILVAGSGIGSAGIAPKSVYTGRY